jgi:hypothetical protein
MTSLQLSKSLDSIYSSWFRDLSEQEMVTRAVQKISAFYGNYRVIPAFANTHNGSVS